MDASKRKRWLRFIQFILAVLALGFLAKSIEVDQLLSSLQSINPSWFFMAVLLLPVNLLLEAKKWHLLIRKVAPSTKFGAAFGSMMAGFSLGLFTPVRLGDYAGRALYLDHRNKWELVALTFTDRMISLSAYITFGLISLTLYLNIDSSTPGYLSYPVFYASAVLVLLIAYCLINPGSIYRAVVSSVKIERLRSVISFLSRLSHKDVVVLFSIATTRYFVFTTQFVLIVYSFGTEVSLVLLYMAATLVFLTKSIVPSFTLLELGIREGAAVFFFGSMGVAAAIAFDSALILFALNLLLPALLGVPFIFRLKDWKYSR